MEEKTKSLTDTPSLTGFTLSSETELMSLVYQLEEPPFSEAAILAWNARDILLQSKVVSELDHYVSELSLNEVNFSAGHMSSVEHVQKSLKFLRKFNWTVEYLIFASAFERFSKAALLNKGFLVHEVKGDKALYNAQKKKPLTMSEFRAWRKKSGELNIAQTTLSLSQLLKPAYAQHLGFSSRALREMGEVAKKRNQIHFVLISSNSTSSEGSVSRLLALQEVAVAVLNNPLLERFAKF